jgi:hypothetical protein
MDQTDESEVASVAARRNRPRTIDFPYEDTLKVSSSVGPVCVSPGESVELRVTAPPEGALAYQAVYSDGQAGSAPPFGAGYGGNESGNADESGEYSSSWVVSPQAPPGRARVDVFVGHAGEWGYAKSRFAVADAQGNCPADWVGGH